MNEIPRLVTAREAADMLAPLGAPRTSVRRALAAGVAGKPVRTRGALLYQHDLLAALLQPPVHESDLPHPLGGGTFVARLRIGKPDTVRFDGVGADASWRASVSGGWRMAWQTRFILHVRATKGLPMPFLATCGGFVMVGASILGARACDPLGTRTQLELGPAGPWYADLHHRLLRTPPGKPWIILPRRRLLNPWFGDTTQDSAA